MASTDSALMAALLSNASDIEPSPWSGAGATILQSQLPRATNNTEAILGPILQGLIGGGLYGYGQGQTNKASFDAFSQNPILQSLGGSNPNGIGPVASGNEYGADLLAEAYGSGVMPATWTPQQGKADLISALITKNAIDEDEARKADFRQKVAEAGAIEEAKLAAKQKFDGGLPGIPKNLEGDVIKEAANQATKQQSLDFIDQRFEDAKKLVGGSAAVKSLTGIPTAKGNELEGLADSVIVQIDKALGREMNSDVRRRILSLAPKFYDSAAEIDKKKENLKALVSSLSPATPVSESLGLIKQPNKEIIPDGAVATGRKTKSGKPTYIINGVEGVLE